MRALNRLPDSEPDARFTLANERTLLAWVRTSLALLAAAVAAQQLLPASLPERRLLALGLGAASAALGLAAYPQWRLVDRALRTNSALPRSPITGVVATIVGLGAVGAVVLFAR